MQEHRFAVGQRVHSAGTNDPTPFGRPVPVMPPGMYEVVRHLPSIRTGWQYRVRSVHDGHERVVLESDLHL